MATSGLTQAFTSVNPANWVFGEVKKLANGSGSIRIKQSATNSLAPVFILDRMRTPFGIEDPLVEEGKAAVALESTRRNLTLSVDNPDLQSWLGSLDEQLIEWVFRNSTTLFGKVIKRSTVEDVIYYRALRPARGEYSPTFRVKVNIHGQNQTKFLINIPGTTSFFQGEYTEVPRGSEVIPTVTAYNMWATANQIGITFIATHLLVFQPALASANPYQGYTEAPRPPPRATAAPQAAPAAAAQNISEDAFNFENDQDPTSMF
jgi:hypothetical protein